MSQKMAIVICGSKHDVEQVLAELAELHGLQTGEPEDLGVSGVRSESLIVELFSNEDLQVLDKFVERQITQRGFLSIGLCKCE